MHTAKDELGGARDESRGIVSTMSQAFPCDREFTAPVQAVKLCTEARKSSKNAWAVGPRNFEKLR